VKSVRVLILSSVESTMIQIARTLEKSTKYDITLFGFGVENEFIKRFYNITLLKKQSSERDLISALLELCEKNKIDVIIPASSKFLDPLCENLEKFRNISVELILPVTDPTLLEILFHRPTLFEYSKNVLSLPIPKYKLVQNRKMIQEVTKDLGYPGNPVLFSHSRNGQDKNIRLVDGSSDIKKLYFDEKPDAVYSTLHQFISDLDDSFSEIIAIEFDCIIEYNVEVLCRKGVTFALLVYPSNPLSNKLNTHAVLTKDQHFPAIEKIAKRVVEGFGISYSVGMRIWIDSNGNAKLIDVVPNLRDDVILCLHGGVNFPELMIDMALQEFDYDYSPKIKWGLQMQQVWLELLNHEGEVWKTDL